MAGVWLCKFFFRVVLDRDRNEVHKHAKKDRANIQPSRPKKLVR